MKNDPTHGHFWLAKQMVKYKLVSCESILVIDKASAWRIIEIYRRRAGGKLKVTSPVCDSSLIGAWSGIRSHQSKTRTQSLTWHCPTVNENLPNDLESNVPYPLLDESSSSFFSLLPFLFLLPRPFFLTHLVGSDTSSSKERLTLPDTQVKQVMRRSFRQGSTIASLLCYDPGAVTTGS